MVTCAGVGRTREFFRRYNALPGKSWRSPRLRRQSMPENEDRTKLPRREFLKATGSLVVGFSAAETLAAQSAAKIQGARGTVSGPPDDAEIDSYIEVHPNNTVTIFS